MEGAGPAGEQEEHQPVVEGREPEEEKEPEAEKKVVAAVKSGKVEVRLQAAGDAPIMKQKNYKVHFC
jgi:hypothetical protein